MLIEVTTFRTADDAEERDWLAADRAVQAELSPRAGFVRRTTARGEADAWLVITCWRTGADADRSAGTPFDDAEARALEDLVDPASLETARYLTLD